MKKFKNRKGRENGERERRVPERKTVGERGRGKPIFVPV